MSGLNEAGFQEVSYLLEDRDFCGWFLANSPHVEQMVNRHVRDQLHDQLDGLPITPCGPIEVDVTQQQLEALFTLVGAQWERVGKAKPHWSVLSSDEYLPEALTEERLREFYASGAEEVHLLETLCARNEVTLPQNAHCLEFGCGVGRVTLHLSRRFSTVEGVDISSPNLAECLKVLSREGRRNVTARQLRSPSEVSSVAPFDVLFTRIVLQHNPPPIQKFILSSLLERLRPGGVALFQTIVHGRGYRYNAAGHLANAQTEVFEMHALPMREVLKCIELNSCKCLEVMRETAGGFGVGSYTFLVHKPAEVRQTAINRTDETSAPRISVITHVYNEQATMDAHVRLWKSLPREIVSQVEFLCVDDCSDVPLKIDKGHLNIRLFRVTDEIEWNMPGCKNLAVAMSRADWLMFFDVDNIINASGFQRIVASLGTLKQDTMYRFRRVQEGHDLDSHINTMVLSKNAFFKAGWMDEDFSGHYGFDDVHFHHMWAKCGGKQVLITDIAFEQLNIRTQNLNRDQSHNQALIQRKVLLEGVRGSVGKIRFSWEEVNLG
jgi:2-polyprenyl-3-methyl-5-hydroxy-6-metoxy-1,4-benzoquinol methylase